MFCVHRVRGVCIACEVCVCVCARNAVYLRAYTDCLWLNFEESCRCALLDIGCAFWSAKLGWTVLCCLRIAAEKLLPVTGVASLWNDVSREVSQWLMEARQSCSSVFHCRLFIGPGLGFETC